MIAAKRFVPAITTALEELKELSPGIWLVTGVIAQPRDSAERTEQACLAFDQIGL